MNEVVILLLIIFPLANCQQSNSTQLNSTAACSDAYKYPSDSPIGQNIQTVFANLLRDAPATGYNSSTVGSSGNTVYGLLNCRGDISTAECRTCATAAVRILNNSCVRNSTKGGRVLLDTCSLRYEDHFFASTLDTVSDQSNCSSGANASAAYRANYDTAVTFLQNQVPTRPRKFASTVAGFGTSSAVYALGQCILDLSTTDCSACLTSARNVLSRSCPSGNSGFSYLPTCTIEFEGAKFFQSVAENATLSRPSKGGSSKGLAVGLPVGIGGALALAALGFCVYRMSHKGRKRLQRTPGELDELQATLHRGPVTFSYDLLRRVTQDFRDDYKLGEGGFGSVYKGTFSDGTEIAIKKLSVASKQGETQFLNEVKVISSVQHRNLVRLLGCCVEGTERLLVYEFLKNNSLENALFGSSGDKPQLSWEMRYNILMGTARGLTYLHEDSQVRIVHRDIKPSNILLDEAYEAKISDFGLARLYGEDETSEIITTKVAGTYGYMAPEYAFHGHLSEKADVFSFGIVMLETVTGRKNRDITLPGEQQYLLEWAWQLHSEGSLSNLIDPNLVNCEQKPILEVMHIAVMCTQGSPQARPSMSHVVAMLSGHSNVQVPLGGSFDFGALRPLSYVSQGTSSSAASNDPKRNQNQLKELSKTFSHPEPR